MSEYSIPKGSPSITIDDVLVTLMYKIMFHGYLTVIYKCGDDFASAYLSRSEGLWRLLVVLDPKKPYMQKGRNYITTTQINIKLQCFISQKINDIPLIDAFNMDDYNDVLYLKSNTPRGQRMLEAIGMPTSLVEYGKRGLLNSIPHNYFKVKREREYLHPLFQPLTIACDEACFSNIFSKIYDKFSQIRRTGYLIQSPYLKKLQELFGIGVKNSIINTPVFRNESVISTEDRYKTLVVIISEYMKHFCTVTSEPSEFICVLPMAIKYFKFDFNYFTQVGEAISTSMDVRVYKTTITLKSEPSTSFHIYYGVYTMPENSFHAGTYKLILNILPATSKIGPFGLNDTYISANVYVYKMFDYYIKDHEQVQRRNGSPMYSDSYKFTGDLLTNMWPLNNVREDVATGGKRRRKTRKTRKATKTIHRRKIK
jgi:hypothetical protein